MPLASMPAGIRVARFAWDLQQGFPGQDQVGCRQAGGERVGAQADGGDAAGVGVAGQCESQAGDVADRRGRAGLGEDVVAGAQFLDRAGEGGAVRGRDGNGGAGGEISAGQRCGDVFSVWHA